MLINNLPHYSFKEIGLQNQMAILVNWNESPLYNSEEFHSHEFYDILIFKKGSGTHIIDFHKEDIMDYSVHVVSNKSTHKAEKSIDSEGFSILVSQFYIEQLQHYDNGIDFLSFINKSRIINFPENHHHTFAYFFSELKASQVNGSYFLNTIASFLSKLAVLSNKSIVIDAPDEFLTSFINSINKDFLDKECLKNFETNNNFTETTLRRKIKRLTGKTPTQHLQEKIHMECKRLLHNTTKSIKEIAFKMGFEDESYFCKWFKKREKSTALAFRKKYK